MADPIASPQATQPLRVLLQQLRENQSELDQTELLGQLRAAAREHVATFEILDIDIEHELCPHCQSPALRAMDSHIHAGYACEFTQTSCGMINQLRAEAEDAARKLSEVQGLLQRIAQWDQLATTADGPYWQREINTVLEGLSVE